MVYMASSQEHFVQHDLQSYLQTGQVGFGLSGFLLPAFCHWRLLKPEGIDAVLNVLLAVPEAIL